MCLEVMAFILLCMSLQTDPGHLESFQKLLADNPCVFHACRSPTSLHHHWVLMGHYSLLNNQKGVVSADVYGGDLERLCGFGLHCSVLLHCVVYYGRRHARVDFLPIYRLQLIDCGFFCGLVDLCMIGVDPLIATSPLSTKITKPLYFATTNRNNINKIYHRLLKKRRRTIGSVRR